MTTPIANTFTTIRAEESPRLRCIAYNAGVLCFPRIKLDAPVDVERLYPVLTGTYKTMVGPGHWFEWDRRHMRVGFGWPDDAQLRSGLENISRALRAAAK